MHQLIKKVFAFIMGVCMLSCMMKNVILQAAPQNIKNQTFCAGTYFSAFVMEDNSLWTCGGSGVLGKSYIMPEQWMAGNWLQESNGVPVKVMDDVKSVYSNGDMTCYVIKLDNSLWALGENDGAFGDGTIQPSKVPVKIMDDVVYIESKKYSEIEKKGIEGQDYLSYHGNAVIALKSDGSLWSWGTNHWGEVGDGTREPRLLPVKIMDHVAFATNGKSKFGMNDEFLSTYAVKIDGSLWAWGSNDVGQLGNGTMDSQVVPVRIIDNVQTIEADDGTCYITKQDGSYWGWGLDYSNAVGGLALYTIVCSPKKIADGVAAVTAGDLEKYFIKEDGTLWAWGRAPRLDLTGSGQSFDAASPVPIMSQVRDIHDGEFTTFAIRTDNVLWGWGFNDDGEIGIGDLSVDIQTNPIAVMDQVDSVYTTSFSTYILRTDGTLWGCGSDAYGQFGQGSHERRAIPVKIADHVKVYQYA